MYTNEIFEWFLLSQINFIPRFIHQTKIGYIIIVVKVARNSAEYLQTEVN